MPAPLQPVSRGSGPYLPPADIGGARDGALVTASTGMPQGLPMPGQSANSVSSQTLPPLTPSRSTQSMPAQMSPQSVEVASRPMPVAPPKMTAAPAANAHQHQIASGESLYSIARRYGVTTDAIVHANGLPSPDKIFVGQKVIIPGVAPQSQQQVAAAPQQSAPRIDRSQTGAVPVRVAPPAAPAPAPKEPVQTANAAPATIAPQPVAPTTSGGMFRWPVSGTVIGTFASSKNGINIAVAEGTAVRAAEAGEVLYVGSAVEGYGNLILIRHENGYVSAYAHLKDITVAKGDRVGRGEAIGSAGMTGAVNKPQLHFELRKGATPVDPMPLLAG